jgi:hypothetical protein
MLDNLYENIGSKKCQLCGGYPLCYYAVPISDGRITDFLL